MTRTNPRRSALALFFALAPVNGCGSSTTPDTRSTRLVIGGLSQTMADRASPRRIVTLMAQSHLEPERWTYQRGRLSVDVGHVKPLHVCRALTEVCAGLSRPARSSLQFYWLGANVCHLKRARDGGMDGGSDPTEDEGGAAVADGGVAAPVVADGGVAAPVVADGGVAAPAGAAGGVAAPAVADGGVAAPAEDARTGGARSGAAGAATREQDDEPEADDIHEGFFRCQHLIRGDER